MSGWIKCFENGGKNMLFKIYIKCNSIWKKIKELLSVKFYSEPIHDDSYIKSKFTTFSDVIKTLFDGGDKNPDEIPKERVEYACIACTSVDSVLKVDKKNYPQVYLEQCKCKINKKETKSFIDDYEIV